METVDRRIPCKMCGKNMMNCVGHAGHLELPTPVYNAGEIERVAKVLKCVCFHDCAILVPCSDPRVLAIAKNTFGKNCFNCIVRLFKSNLSKRLCPACDLS
jgi:DNA-directed RNA polymerase II subunit RPB1